ncbi:hypothetical protein SDJN03_22827, partial [Cucurbita argyrosperma subsp. sororia]
MGSCNETEETILRFGIEGEDLGRPWVGLLNLGRPSAGLLKLGGPWVGLLKLGRPCVALLKLGLPWAGLLQLGRLGKAAECRATSYVLKTLLQNPTSQER